MAQIPTLNGLPQVQSAPIGGAERSGAGDQALLQGRMALAQAIGDVGRTVGNFALATQQAKNVADETNARLVMERVQASVVQDMEQNADPSKWAALRQARIEEAQGEIFASERGGRMAEPVRQKVNDQFKAWVQDIDTQGQTLELRKQNDESRQIIRLGKEREIAAGNLPGAIGYIDQMEAVGLISEKAAVIERQDATYRVDVQMVNRDIAKDPFAALEKLEDTTEGGKPRNYRQLSEKDRLAAIRSTKNAMETAREENVRGLQEDIIASGGVGAEAKIDAVFAKGHILPSQAIALKKFAAGQRSPQDQAAEGAQLWQSAIDLDPADPDYIQKAMRLRASTHTLDPAVRNPILETLDAKDKNDVSADTQKVFEMLNRDFRANTFGNAQTWTAGEAAKFNSLSERQRKKQFPGIDPTQTIAEGDPKNRADFENASATLFRYQRAMREFLQANPKATFEQIQQKRAELTATDRQAVLGGLAIDALSGARQ